MRMTYEFETEAGLKMVSTHEITVGETVKTSFDISIKDFGIVGKSIVRWPVRKSGVEYAATCGKFGIKQHDLNMINRNETVINKIFENNTKNI